MKKTPQTPNTTLCDDVLGLIPAYSIGATDPDEKEFVNRHLAECPEAIDELSKYTQLAEMLHYAMLPMEAPPALADKIRAQLRQPGAPKSSRRLKLQQPAIWALAIAVFALLAINLSTIVQLVQMRSRQDSLESVISDQNRALMLLGLGATTRLELTPGQSDTADIPYAAIVWNPKSEYALLYVKDFPLLGSDQSYQLWLQKSVQPMSAGSFQVDKDGIGSLFFKTKVPVIDYDSITITREPVTGSIHPSSWSVIVYKRS